MTTSTIFHRDIAVTAGRPALDTLVERLALGMLRWSGQRAQSAALKAERSTEREVRVFAYRSAHERAIDAGRTFWHC